MKHYRTFAVTIITGNNTHTINKFPRDEDSVDEHTIIFNDGPGDINIKLNYVEEIFGDTHVMKPTDPPLEIHERIRKVRIIYSGTDASYRILAY